MSCRVPGESAFVINKTLSKMREEIGKQYTNFIIERNFANLYSRLHPGKRQKPCMYKQSDIGERSFTIRNRQDHFETPKRRISYSSPKSLPQSLCTI